MNPDDMLPAYLQRYFWDCDPAAISIVAHISFIIKRLLVSGDWNAISWLRKTIGYNEIKNWLISKQGKPFDVRRLRFWEITLGLPEAMVNGLKE